MKLMVFEALTVLAFSGFALQANAAGPPGPCMQIAQACEAAGFIKGDWKKGDGLWRDCVDPIVQGQTSVPGGTKPLPSVAASTVAACKAKNPKFGEGKVGSVPAPGLGSTN
jgi:hypothetical protein